MTESERVVEAAALMPEAVEVYMLVKQTARKPVPALAPAAGWSGKAGRRATAPAPWRGGSPGFPSSSGAAQPPRKTARNELSVVATPELADALGLELRTVRKALKALATPRVGLLSIDRFDENGRCFLFLPWFTSPGG